jgi:uncharacterized protein
VELSEIQEQARTILEMYPEVVCAYLFGSFADGVQRSSSDVDLAILLDDNLDKFKAFEMSLAIGDELERRLRRKVDLIVLNHAHLAIAFQAIRGRLIYDTDPVKRSLFAARIMSRYYDYKRYLDFHWKAISARAREGKFGTVG